MKLAVIGSRSLSEINFEKYIEITPSVLISGGALGVDSAAERWAANNGIATIIFKPEYERYKRAAPLVRNKKIVESCEMLFAFWDGKSKGTIHTVNYAKRLGKNVKIFELPLATYN